MCGKEKPLKLRSSQDLNLSLSNSGQMLSHWSSGIRAEMYAVQFQLDLRSSALYSVIVVLSARTGSNRYGLYMPLEPINLILFSLVHFQITSLILLHLLIP